MSNVLKSWRECGFYRESSDMIGRSGEEAMPPIPSQSCPRLEGVRVCRVAKSANTTASRDCTPAYPVPCLKQVFVWYPLVVFCRRARVTSVFQRPQVCFLVRPARPVGGPTRMGPTSRPACPLPDIYKGQYYSLSPDI